MEAASLAASLAADAEASAKRRERMAIERIAAAEASAVAEIRATAIDIATAASAALLADTFGAEADAPLLDKAIAAAPAALRGSAERPPPRRFESPHGAALLPAAVAELGRTNPQVGAGICCGGRNDAQL